MQAVAVAIAKTMWAWGKRGKCEETMREMLGAGRGVHVQAGEIEMAAEAQKERQAGSRGR